MGEPKKKTPQLYALSLSYRDDFDRLKKLVEIFSYHWKMEGRVSNVLRNKLVVLLTLYLKDGFSSETKDKACAILGVEKESINSMNLELRQGNYLYKDKMNTRINHLHDDLKTLKEYTDRLKEGGGEPLVVFKFKLSNG